MEYVSRIGAFSILFLYVWRKHFCKRLRVNNPFYPIEKQKNTVSLQTEDL